MKEETVSTEKGREILIKKRKLTQLIERERLREIQEERVSNEKESKLDSCFPS